MLKNMNYDEVCKYYNPYFQDGCQADKECSFIHLPQDQYLKFINFTYRRKNSDLRSFRLGLNKFHRNQYETARNIFKSLCHIDPHNAQNNLYYARSLEKMGMLKAAEYHYRKAISIQPQNATFVGRYATLLHMKMNKYSEAKHFYEIALSIRDDINAIHCHYGKLLFDYYHNYEKAMYHFEKCLSIFDDDEECHFYYGQLVYKLGNYKNAKYHLERALCLQNKPYIWHHFYYALNCMELKEYFKAKEQLQICLDLQIKYNNCWSTIHFEYGLLIYFIFKSSKIGLKHIQIAIKLSYNNNNSNTMQLKHVYNKLKNSEQYNIKIDERNYLKFRHRNNSNKLKQNQKNNEEKLSEKSNEKCEEKIVKIEIEKNEKNEESDEIESEESEEIRENNKNDSIDSSISASTQISTSIKSSITPTDYYIHNNDDNIFNINTDDEEDILSFNLDDNLFIDDAEICEIVNFLEKNHISYNNESNNNYEFEGRINQYR